MNRVFLIGNIGKDIELRYTQNQTAVTTLSVATNEFVKDEQQTEWHSVVVWGKMAENCRKYLQKGAKISVEGRLQTRSWQDKSSQTKYVTEIIANNVEFLSKPNNSTKDGMDNADVSNTPAQNTGPIDMDNMPF